MIELSFDVELIIVESKSDRSCNQRVNEAKRMSAIGDSVARFRPIGLAYFSNRKKTRRRRYQVDFAVSYKLCRRRQSPNCRLLCLMGHVRQHTGGVRILKILLLCQYVVLQNICRRGCKFRMDLCLASSFITLRASCGAMYCNRSCLWVCLWVGLCGWVGLLPPR